MTLIETVPQNSKLDPLRAGAFLVTVLALFVGAGALVGLAAGSVGVGIAVGAVLGVPGSIAAVVVRYRKRV
jgi:hypothetical protein